MKFCPPRLTLPIALLSVSLLGVTACASNSAYLREEAIAAEQCRALRTGPYVPRVHECHELYRAVERKYGTVPHPDIEIVRAYRVAVAERLDRREISYSQA